MSFFVLYRTKCVPFPVEMPCLVGILCKFGQKNRCFSRLFINFAMMRVKIVYRVTLVVSDLGWDDLDFECYVLWSMKIQVNPTQVRDHQCHPVQRSAKVGAPGLVNFITAVAYHFCPSLPAAFTQPGASTLADLCIWTTFPSPNQSVSLTGCGFASNPMDKEGNAAGG